MGPFWGLEPLPLWYTTHHLPMMNPHTKFDNPRCFGSKVLLWTQFVQGFTIIKVKGQSQGHSDLNLECDTSPSHDASIHHTPNLIILGAMVQNFCSRHEAGQTDKVIPIYPPNFVCRGYNKLQTFFMLHKFQRSIIKFSSSLNLELSLPLKTRVTYIAVGINLTNRK